MTGLHGNLCGKYESSRQSLASRRYFGRPVLRGPLRPAARDHDEPPESGVPAESFAYSRGPPEDTWDQEDTRKHRHQPHPMSTQNTCPIENQPCDTMCECDRISICDVRDVRATVTPV